MKGISKNQLEELRSRSDIVEVIGSYLRLQRAGASFKALCPFHKEKTPSFHVNPARQIFHCFGCGAGGDVFRFIMQYQGVDFPTAVRILADRAGMVLEWEDVSAAQSSERDALFGALQMAADFYHRMLIDDPSAAEAREYVQSRDLRAAVKPFLFGFSPVSAEALLEFARRKRVAPELLEKAGVLARSEGRRELYDRFRGRLVIPIRDEIGRIIGFTARVLPSDSSPAKYVNSPETPLFRKSRVLFAFDRARRAIVEQRCAILCEGQIDVIRCHLAGIENAVAAQGTAVTEDHAHLLRRYADEVVVMLDADEAGQRAALRSAEILLAAELSLRIATLPMGEDPDSLLRKAGRAALDQAVAKAAPIVRFLVEVARAKGEMENEAGIRRTARAVLEVIRHSPSPAHREVMLREAATCLRLSETALREQLRQLPRAAARAASDDKPAESTPPPSEVGVLALALRSPEVLPLLRRHLPERLLTDPTCVQIYRTLLEAPPEEWNLRLFAPDRDEAVARLSSALMAAPAPAGGTLFSPETAAKDYLLALWRNELQRRRDHLMRTSKGTPEEERAINRLTHHLGLLRRGWEDAAAVMELYEEE